MAAELIGGSVDVGEPLVGQGLDSLASMELRQKLQVGAKGLTCNSTAIISGYAAPRGAVLVVRVGDTDAGVCCDATVSDTKLMVAARLHQQLHVPGAVALQQINLLCRLCETAGHDC